MEHLTSCFPQCWIKRCWFPVIVLLVFTFAGRLNAQEFINVSLEPIVLEFRIRTFAGGGAGDGDPPTESLLRRPSSVNVAPDGSVVISGTDNYLVRRVEPDGTIRTIAGTGNSSYSGDGGPGTSASLRSPQGLAVDASGNVYVSDEQDHRVRRIDSSGTITTFAGTGDQGFGGDGGFATDALLHFPSDVAVDEAGNLYIADRMNHRIRRVGLDGRIQTVAGSEGAGLGDGGPATDATLSSPRGVTVTTSGELLIADTENHRIRLVSVDGVISTVAGTGLPDFGFIRRHATASALKSPRKAVVRQWGGFYIADTGNDRILSVDAEGFVGLFAGVPPPHPFYPPSPGAPFRCAREETRIMPFSMPRAGWAPDHPAVC